MGIIEDLQEKIKTSNGSVEEMQCIFYETAKELLNGHVLEIKDKDTNKVLTLELKELEFYFFDCRHPDIYTHLDKIQKKFFKLYVHKKVDGRGGIDITFGNGEYYGGILIRGIKYTEDEEELYISGPANVRKFIIDYFNKKNHNELRNFFNNKNKCEIKLNRKETKKNPILHSTRIGLNLELDPIYANALYRIMDFYYLVNNTKHKNKNVPEITKSKVISSETGILNNQSKNKSYQQELQKINNTLSNNIKLFKQKCKKEN